MFKNNSNPSVVYNDINFEDRSELLLFKSLMAWVALRFSTAVGQQYEGDLLKKFQQIQSVEQIKKAGIISENDAWTVEKNSMLYTAVASEFLKEHIPQELYDSYGNILFSCSKSTAMLDISMVPTVFDLKHFRDIAPCSMFIAKNDELIEKYKEHDSIIRKETIDIIPLLKSMVGEVFTKEDNTRLNEIYNKWKNDPEVVDAKNRIMQKREQEQKNLANVLNAITVQGDRMVLAKLAVALYTIVKYTYSRAPHSINKIKFMPNGSGEPVLDFSRVFKVNCIDDVQEVKNILDPIVHSDIKIKVHEDNILFTTSSKLDPSDEDAMTDVTGLKIDNLTTLDYVFENHVGPITSVDDVHKIMDKVLYEKYQNEYF